MNLNETQFDVLSLLAEDKRSLTQRQIAKITNHSVGTINKTIKELDEIGYINNSKVTEKGYNALEPYKAKRAIFLASGFGSRLVPITLNTPKPLVRVFGVRIIDRLIDAVLDAGIQEVIIVRGYLSEQFDQLKDKYPMIKFVDNPIFNESNNISSALQVRDLLENAYVFEADLLIYNPSVIKKYNYGSNFLGFDVDRTDDWCFTVKNNYIDEEKIGGINCVQMIGISYWDKQDGQKLYFHLKQAFDQPGGKELYWEQVPLVKFKEQYKVYVRKCEQNDIVEIDTFNELKSIDKSYCC
ncbi:MAG: winged helix-turn-helix transcriptional regulator [Ruminococcaceae bacterium]|nr:winged helix-turn-helix transcriptional regulator [Oscillospiraceae bacterium]